MTVPRRETRLRPRREPRQVRASETRTRILEAAATVFEARGYDGGTTNHIAAEASISVGSLYQYFPNKDSILVELMVTHITDGGDRIRASIAEWQSSTAAIDDLVERVVTTLLALHRETPVLHQILMTRVPLPPDVAARIEALEAAFVVELAEQLEAVTDVPGEDVLVKATMATAAVNALVHQQVARPEPPIPDIRFAEETTRLVAAYLKTAR